RGVRSERGAGRAASHALLYLLTPLHSLLAIAHRLRPYRRRSRTPLTAHRPSSTKAMPSHSIARGFSSRINHASSTPTMGTPRLPTLASVVGSRRSTIDQSHQARLDAISTL